MAEIFVRDGILLYNKEKFITSFKAIKKIKKILNINKIGHSGILDYNAEGLLVVGIEKATKLLKYFIKSDKSYEAIICFGKETTTDDASGKVVNEYHGKINFDKIKDTLLTFKGEINQIPPSYSNVHVNGTKAYKLALKNITPELKSRTVKIYDYQIISYDEPFLKIKIHCSSGTYIRSVARDLGRLTGYYAYLFYLKRTKVGNFDISSSYTIEEIKNGNYNIISPFDACYNFLPLEINKKYIQKVKNGAKILKSWFNNNNLVLKEENIYKIHYKNELIAVVKYSNGEFIYDVVY